MGLGAGRGGATWGDADAPPPRAALRSLNALALRARARPLSVAAGIASLRCVSASESSASPPARLPGCAMEAYHKPDQQKLQALKDTANRLRISSIQATTAAGSG